MSDLDALEQWAAPLLEALSATQRRRLARVLARELRARQARRIRDQEAPDGSNFTPRKSGERAPMFAKLQKTKHLKGRGDGDNLDVRFRGRAAHIARIHHHGLKARVEPGGPKHDYTERTLLGMSNDDRDWLRDRLLDHLNG